jgi:hypothetical protein
MYISRRSLNAALSDFGTLEGWARSINVVTVGYFGSLEWWNTRNGLEGTYVATSNNGDGGSQTQAATARNDPEALPSMLRLPASKGGTSAASLI